MVESGYRPRVIDIINFTFYFGLPIMMDSISNLAMAKFKIGSENLFLSKLSKHKLYFPFRHGRVDPYLLIYHLRSNPPASNQI